MSEQESFTASATNEQMEKKIREAGMRPSSARIKVLRYLEEEKNHPSVDQIYKALLPELPSLSRASVYNSLAALHKLGLVRQLALGGDEMRYDSFVKDHGHFCCEECGGVFDFDFESPKTSLEISEFIINRTDYLIWGICQECLKK